MSRFLHNQRNDTSRRPVPHEVRVVRTVVQPQEDLARPLALLRQGAGNLVAFKPLEKLGVTMAMLDPVLSEVFDENNPKNISVDKLALVEAGLKKATLPAQYEKYTIGLADAFSPLALYGHRKRWLGLKLLERDYRLVGDRAVVEQYFIDEYGVSRRGMERLLRKLSPHITIGEVQYQNFEPNQIRDFQDDPSNFMIRYANQRLRDMHAEFRTPGEAPTVDFPDAVALNGLSIFVQARAHD